MLVNLKYSINYYHKFILTYYYYWFFQKTDSGNAFFVGPVVVCFNIGVEFSTVAEPENFKVLGKKKITLIQT
jgi:hypothetical protein